jgi:hypothetical protein
MYWYVYRVGGDEMGVEAQSLRAHPPSAPSATPDSARPSAAGEFSRACTHSLTGAGDFGCWKNMQGPAKFEAIYKHQTFVKYQIRIFWFSAMFRFLSKRLPTRLVHRACLSSAPSFSGNHFLCYVKAFHALTLFRPHHSTVPYCLRLCCRSPTRDPPLRYWTSVSSSCQRVRSV